MPSQIGMAESELGYFGIQALSEVESEVIFEAELE